MGETATCIMDASSLIDMDKYYLTLDKEKIFRNWLASQLKKERMLILKAVRAELKYNAESIIALIDGLEEAGDIATVENVHPGADEYQTIDTWAAEEFLSHDDYEYLRDKSIARADFQIILKAMEINSIGGDATVVTEETDRIEGRRFRKMPSICAMQGIACMNLATYLLRSPLETIFRVRK